MPDAVIVATARSPIGRAVKGSLKDIRPSDLAVQMVQAALAKVPALDAAEIDDLMLGCGLPRGEQGFNMARVVAIMLGYDHLPGTTLTRYCASSVQTSRMAFHAIKAGEGDAFVSAGVECVSRYVNGNSDTWPETRNPVFDEARRRTATTAEGGAGAWHDPRADGLIPDIYIPMGQTAENLAQSRGISRRELDEFGVRSQNLAEEAIKAGFPLPELKPEMEALQERKAALQAQLAAVDEPPPLLHPSMADLYRSKVEELASALQREDTRLEASEMLRGLIDSIDLIPDEGQLRIELRGNLAAMLTAAQQTKRSPETGDLLVPVQMVAGARNPLNLEFAWAAV